MTTPQPASSEPMPGPQEIPAAFQPNGHSPSQMALAMMHEMPQMLAQAFASVLQQVPVRTAGQFRCAQCVLIRLGWIAAHQQYADAAHETFMQALQEQAALPDADPRKSVPLDYVMFLPEPLRPGAGPQAMPPIQEGVVMMNGAVWCIEHVPGAPGKSKLLVAQAGLSSSALASLNQ